MTKKPKRKPKGLTIEPILSTGAPSIQWTTRDVVLHDAQGQVIFEQKNVEVPGTWSQQATDIVAKRYLAPQDKGSVRKMVARVVDAIVDRSRQDRYFTTKKDREVFRQELTYIILHQYGSFNSPVWFNVGVKTEPQCSACFITSVDDNMESILDLTKTESRIFKAGSGSGVNLSHIRGKGEKLSNGGSPSGPVSFMRGFDAFAGIIKSGGKTRRAACMRILDADHPDIEEFISCKADEEKKIQALIAHGIDPDLAYQGAWYQNANNSVRLPNSFFQAVRDGATWILYNRNNLGRYSLSAKRLLRDIVKAIHACGDPGIQYTDTINRAHTCPSAGPIRGSNPCSEYLFIDDSACNLASLNLLKFVTNDDSTYLDIMRFDQAVNILIIAQDLIVTHSSYPTEEIRKNALKYRPLGLGFANLGAFLMVHGLPYDSNVARNVASYIAECMTKYAIECSARIAEVVGPFPGYEENRESSLSVMKPYTYKRLFRNAQVTAIAPTGTIGFMMDCDTTGIEPDYALVKTKRVADGSEMRIVNRSVGRALDTLGYEEKKKQSIIKYLEENGTIEGAPDLSERDLPIFDCAARAPGGKRVIHPLGHVRMLAAVQEHITGGISKTINVPQETTVEDIEKLICKAWGLGIKSISIYRDGCKQSQPLNIIDKSAPQKAPAELPSAARRRLPDERKAVTHKFSIAGHEGYLTVGLYDDGAPGEIFVTMSKQGSTISGLMDTLATSTSVALQYGVPLSVLCNKFIHTRYDPSGFTSNPEIPIARSITDYLFRWLALRFCSNDVDAIAWTKENLTRADLADTVDQADQTDATICPDCGALMVRNGTCHKCTNCGSTSGCS
jgi:ribonucleoside-diphosphate reductase alpha chain